ncbi:MULTISPECIES: hypothetical protein [Clostridium]|uniref:Uncharacterized protein n=1 Tax=Clostridium cadaveris TaxID=1529 RepID=A0A1I2LJT5_9CLOT|nr:hypothetical protein [Clostridium cadaveris]MDU4951362.1 hypothetical protein [Clostridium sp.]MDM8312201.1 hypothetical protein [Clostridium cadaveris]MDY4950646.1 hypothetical protein [Clostridium cadaveris]NME65179.1 hypothetical protein [Clostridium cadaveris]NWK10937.1 hypothetical protein [Clostridium cadaveris]
MITAIVIPTPTRVKKVVREFNVKEKIRSEGVKQRIILYGLISGGVGVAIKNPVPAKPIMIGTLIYYGLAYEVIMKWYDKYGDDEELMNLLRNYDYSAAISGRRIFL